MIMKKINHLTGLSFLFLSLAISLASCVKKDSFYDENTAEPNRKQVVQLYGAENEINTKALNVVPTVENFVLIEVVRYPNSQADASQPLTVKLTKNTTLIDDYNTNNGTNFIELPLNSYTLSDDISQLTFAPGESIKQVKLNLKKDLLNLSQPYALGFVLTQVGTGAVINDGLKTVLYSIGLKNSYDGVYSYVSGFVQRYSSPGVPQADNLSGPLGPSNPDIEMATTGAYTVAFGGAGGPVGLTWSGPMSGVAGIDGLTAAVDPNTNNVTMTSSNVTLANWAGHVNKYDPATKTFTIAMKWTSTAPAYREYEVVLKYKGPR